VIPRGPFQPLIFCDSVKTDTMDSFKRKLRPSGQRSMQLFLFGHFDPHNPPKKQKAEGSVQEVQCKQVLSHLWTAVLSHGKFGEPSAAPEI